MDPKGVTFRVHVITYNSSVHYLQRFDQCPSPRLPSVPARQRCNCYYVLDTDPFRQIGFNKMSSISVMLIFNSPLSIFSFKKMSQLGDICKKN